MSGQKQPDSASWEEALPWLAHADADLKVSSLLIGDIDLSLGTAFHCQQAAEKMAKAVLIAFGSAYPKIHDIAELARRLESIHPDISNLVADLSGLTDWYSMSRDPDIEFIPSQQDIQFVLARLKELRKQIQALAPKPSE
jgi:HEPN domain-containing protein